jgi:hypothetical protein
LLRRFAPRNDGSNYFFAFRFFAVLRFFVARFFAAFFGTFLPSALASESPIAMACLRLVTFRPERPLFKVPALRFFITRSTSDDAALEYLLAMIISPFGREQSPHEIKVPM